MGAIVVAIIGAASSAFGGLIGVIINTKLITYRIEQLEIKVNKHNSLIERTYKLETAKEVTEKEIEDIKEDLNDLKRGFSDNKFVKEV